VALKENDLNWFRPLWRRVAVAVFLGLWLAWELLFTRDMFWAFLVAAALAYVGWNFFYNFPKETPNDALPPAGPADDENRQDP
jgi:hypothetical protein